MPATPVMGRRKSMYDQFGHIRSNFVDTPELPRKTIRRSKSNIRWLVLFLSCFSMFGNYYCFDTVTALAKPLKDLTDMSGFQYNMLYSIYSLPNTVLPLAGGVFVDKIGVNTCILIFVTLLVCGQSLFAYGVMEENYYIMLGGRLLYGFGGECLCVSSSALLAAWFKNKEMGFAMAVNLSIARLGSVANDQISPILRKEVSLAFAVWFGAILMGVCLLLTVVLVLVDIQWVKAKEAKGYEVETVTSGEMFEFSDILKFKKIFWILTLSCLVVYGCVIPFNNIAGDFFQDKWDYTETEANALLGIPFAISAVASPFLGGLVDIFGKRAWLFLFASTCLGFAHLMMGLTTIFPVPWLVILGSAYSIYAAAVWPGVALVVPEIQLGTAYGVITSVQNCGLALFPLLVGVINDKTGAYTWVELFFAMLAGCGFISAIFLVCEDSRTGSRLNLPTAKAKKSTVDFKTSVNESGYKRLPDDGAGPIGAIITSPSESKDEGNFPQTGPLEV